MFYDEPMILRVILVVLSSILIGAHFLRHGNLILMLLCIAMPFLLLSRRRWVLIVMQCLLYGAALLWLFFMRVLVLQRMAEQMRFRGVIVILGSVAIFTLISGLLLNSRVMKERYP